MAVPDAAHNRRRAAHVPDVVVVFRRTGLADLVEVAAVDLSCRRQAVRALDRQVQKLIHDRRRVERDRLLGLALLVVVNDVALVVFDAVDRVRLVILAAVAEDQVGRGHLAHADAVFQAADRNAAQVVGVGLGQRRDVQVLRQELVAEHRRHLVDELHHRCVQRFRDREVHVDRAAVAAAEVARAGRAVIEVTRQRLILEHGAVSDVLVFDRRRIDADRLDRRTRGVDRRGNIVPAAVLRLLDIVAVRVHLVGVDGQNAPVVLHQACAGPDVVVVRVLLPVVFEQLLKALLQRHILCGVDLQAAVVEHVDGVVLIDVRVLDQQVDRVLENLLVVPVPDVVLYGSVRILAVLFAVRLIDVEVDAAELQVVGFLHRLVVLGLRDHALVVHFLDDRIAARLVLFRIVENAERRGVLRRRRDRRAFRDAAVPDILAEVALRRRLHAVIAVAEVDDVEVRFEDLVLRIFLFEVQRHEDLADLSRDADLVLARQVLDELLGDRRTARAVRAGDEAVDCAERAVPVDAVVLVEALVLDRDHRILHDLRDLREVDARADLGAVVAHVLGPFGCIHAVDMQRIGDVHEARFIELERGQACGQLRIVVAPDDGKNAEADKAARNDADQQEGLDELAEHREHRLRRCACGTGHLAVGTPHRPAGHLRRVVFIDILFVEHDEPPETILVHAQRACIFLPVFADTMHSRKSLKAIWKGRF